MWWKTRTTPTQPRSALFCHGRWANTRPSTCSRRTSFIPIPTARPGCEEHIDHGHDIPGCADLTTGIESNTLLVGLSTRLRVRPSVYLVGSWTPRASGFRPGVSLKTFGIEKRLRGHVFQLNLSNGLGTTMAEMARGASSDQRLVPRLQYLEEVLLVLSRQLSVISFQCFR